MTIERFRIEQRELFTWLALVGVGLAVTWLAVRYGAKLGSASAPFLGHYQLRIGWVTLLTPAVAIAVIAVGTHGLLYQLSWPQMVGLSYIAGLLWAYTLTLAQGVTGLTAVLTNTLNTPGPGHPPGLKLFLDWLRNLGLSDLSIGTVFTALGMLTIPMVLIAVRGSCGDAAARAYAPVLILVPYAIWMAVSLDGIVAVLGATGMMLGERGSQRIQGWQAGALTMGAGTVLGIAALFSYSVPWLGLSLVCLYFARRRPLLHLATGIGALLPVLLATLAGFNWFNGLLIAQDDFITRVEPHRSALWWSGISLVVLLLAAGPALMASMRKLRNTPGWPFLVGAAAAVLFSVFAGFARGGVEHSWLPFFPWLLIAATAPQRQGGEPVHTPWLLVGTGAITAVILEMVLVPGWQGS